MPRRLKGGWTACIQGKKTPLERGRGTGRRGFPVRSAAGWEITSGGSPKNERQRQNRGDPDANQAPIGRSHIPRSQTLQNRRISKRMGLLVEGGSRRRVESIADSPAGGTRSRGRFTNPRSWRDVRYHLFESVLLHFCFSRVLASLVFRISKL